jgi:hypothetical protein
VQSYLGSLFLAASTFAFFVSLVGAGGGAWGALDLEGAGEEPEEESVQSLRWSRCSA